MTMPFVEQVAGDPASAPVQTNLTVSEQYFTAQQVEQFRAQERDKLYPKIAKQDELLEELRSQVSSFAQERQERQKAEDDRVAAEQEAARRAAEEEMSVRDLLKQREQEWENRFAQEREERARERAALEKENEFRSLQAFIQRRVREEQQGKTIAPELLDLVNGSTEEQVEQSIQLLREKTNVIVESMQKHVNANSAPPRGVSPAGYAATGPMEMNSELRQPTPEEIRAMDWDTYNKYRDSIGLGRSSTTKGQGIFG